MNCMVGSKENDKFDLGVEGLNLHLPPIMLTLACWATINLIDNSYNSIKSFISQVWLAFNFSLHYYHSWFEYEDHENKGIDYQFKKFLIVKQFLLSQY